MTLPVQVVSQAAGPLLAGASYDWRGDYEYSMALFAGLAVIAAALVYFARPPVWRTYTKGRLSRDSRSTIRA